MKRYILFLFSTLTGITIQAQSTYNTVIDTDTKYQTIQSFGASDCWTADYIGKYFSNTTKEQSAKWLFSQNMDENGNPEGIGLSIWRINLGAGSAEQGSNSGISNSTHRGYCYLNSDGTYTWTKSAGQQYFMQKAKEYNVNELLFFSNSAPVYYTKNGKAFADANINGSNLRDDCYDKFANYLTTVTKHFTDEGYNVTYISPVNEPQYNWTCNPNDNSGQEGSPWTNENISTLAKSLNQSIKAANLDCKILLPEAASWSYLTDNGSGRGYNQINAFFDNSNNSTTYIGNLETLAPVIAGHSYWTFTTNELLSNTREKVANAAKSYNLKVIQTEWSMLDNAPESSTGFPESYDAASYMDIALYMGKLIYCDLTKTNATSWSYWTAFAQERYSQKNRFYLLRINTDSDTGTESYADDLSSGGTVTDNSNLWVLGNYSFFIRPGYQRVSLSGTDDINGLLGSAYLSPDSKRLVCVYVNMKTTTTGIKIDLGNNNDNVNNISKYVTSKDLNLKKDNTLSSTFSKDSRIAIPSRSVVTFTIDFNSPATGIKTNVINTSKTNHNIYSIDGKLIRRNSSSTAGLDKGIYIHGDKTIIIK